MTVLAARPGGFGADRLVATAQGVCAERAEAVLLGEDRADLQFLISSNENTKSSQARTPVNNLPETHHGGRRNQ